MSKTTETFNLNQNLWQNRYINPANNFTQALKLVKQAEKTSDDKGVAYALLNMSMSCFLQSKNKDAFEFLQKAKEYFINNIEETGYIWMLNLQASLYESIGDYDKALKLALNSFKLAKAISDFETKAESASILGLIYSRISNYKKSLEYYQIALKIRKDNKDLSGVASSYNRMGMVSRMMKDYEKSLSYYQKSLEIREEMKLVGAIPWTMLGLASTYEETGKYEKALEYYLKGLINSDNRCALQCEMGLGRIYSTQGEKTKAEKTLFKALKMAEELQANALIADTYLALSSLYETINNPAKAFATYKKYQQAKEAVLNEEAKNRLRNIEISHAIEKSEQEKEIYRLKHVELKAAYDIIEEKNRNITSSITYARYIQQAILPDLNSIEWLKDKMFVMYHPKDIVSGDFYWFTEIDNKIIIAAADCTGHGVPGSLMSMLGISLLEEIVNKRHVINANEILDNLRKEVIRSLKQNIEKNKARDGMDISLCVIDKASGSMQFSGAMHGLYIIRNNEVLRTKGDKMPIGVHRRMNSNFTLNEVIIKNDDMIFLCSDGFADQFGEKNGERFKTKNLLNLFIESSELNLPMQKEKIENSFLSWKGSHDQIDDVVIIGIRVNLK